MSGVQHGVMPHDEGVFSDLRITIDDPILPPPTATLTQRAGGPGFVAAVRHWYISNYCSDYSVNQLLWVQSFCTEETKIKWLSLYFNLWSEMGNQLFYTLMIPVFVWSGWEEAGFQLCVMLSLGLYLTDAIKDVFGCPRPPSPPVRRGGAASHGLEYGLPSTHTCCACILAREMCYFLGKAYPESQIYFNIFGIIFVFHVGFSRMFLGLHWLADVVAGLACFMFLTLIEVAFLRNLLAYMTEQYRDWPILLPIAAGYLMLAIHPAPTDPCPCYEDSVRFIGVDVGALVGIWLRRRAQVSIERFPHHTVVSYIVSWGFLGRYLTGLVVVVIVKTACGYAAPRALRSLCHFTSGRYMLGKPSFGPNSVQGNIYRLICCASGLLLARRVSWTPIIGPSTPSSRDEMSRQSQEKQYHQEGGSEEGRVNNNSMNMSDAIRVVVEDLTGSPQLQGPPPLPTSSNSRGCTSGSCRSSHDDVGSTTSRGQEDGVYWSLRTHNHWYTHDILAKYVNYMMTGIAVAFFAPLICQRFFYDPMSDLWIV